MGDRDKNFEDPMPTTQVITKTKYHLLGFYLITLYKHFQFSTFFLNSGEGERFLVNFLAKSDNWSERVACASRAT